MAWENNPVKDTKEFNQEFREKNEGHRQCLRCEKIFLSKSPENRLCKNCKESIKNE